MDIKLFDSELKVMCVLYYIFLIRLSILPQ